MTTTELDNAVKEINHNLHNWYDLSNRELMMYMLDILKELQKHKESIEALANTRTNRDVNRL